MVKTILSKLSMPLIALTLVIVLGLYMQHLMDRVEAQAATISSYKISLESAKASLDEASEALKKTAEDIRAGHQENVRVLESLEKRVADNTKTTGELKNELAKTAADRVACKFPEPVMQIIHSARDRAADAASSGLDAAVSGAGQDG